MASRLVLRRFTCKIPLTKNVNTNINLESVYKILRFRYYSMDRCRCVGRLDRTMVCLPAM